MAAQLMATNGFSFRGLKLWMAWAISSLPVPLSPVISTLLPEPATFSMSWNTAVIWGDRVMIFGSNAPAATWDR
jgi:hypothetical protein